MVSKKTLKEYDFESIEQYFDMTIESKVNGQITQAKQQFNKLSLDQKEAFLTYCKEVSINEFNFFYKLLFEV